MPRAEVALRLGARREEIEQALLARVYGIADPSRLDPGYSHGLRQAVSAALDYALSVVELGEVRAPPIPTALIAQARLAARNGIGVETVLRRYVAGYGLLLEFLVAEANETGSGDSPSLLQLVRGHAATLDRLLAAVSEEHSRELASLGRSLRQRRVERVKRLLAGEEIDTADLAYEIDGFHVGVVGAGPDAEAVVRELAALFDCGRLLVPCEEEGLWAWLGSGRAIEAAEIERLVATARDLLPGGSFLALGEPGEGAAGWRLTHRQARAVLPVAREAGEAVVRYADSVLVAAVLQDETVATSLRELYLNPLRGSDNGVVLLETLKAYFAASGHISAAAAALGVSRRTVSNRLLAVERRLGRSVDVCTAELRVALTLAGLDDCAAR